MMQNNNSNFRADRTGRVSILRSSYSDIDIHSLLAPLGGMKGYIEKGDKVLLKMNLLSSRTPEEGVTTHPDFVRAVACEVKRAGGVPYIGDSPAGTFSRRGLSRTYARTGIEKMAKEEGISLNYDTGAKKVNISGGKKLKKIAVCNYILKADKIIGIPKFKTHSLQYLTLACKNMYGAVPGLTKARYHALYPGKTAFAEVLLDLCIHLKPHLFIMDGILALHGQGPGGGGNPIMLGASMASPDFISLDIAACRLIDIEPAGIPVLKRARIRGMWPEGIEYPLLKPEDFNAGDFMMPNTASHLKNGKRGRVKSPVISGKCRGCGECEKICPGQAIKMVDGLACVDYSRCIRCYCCHEVCPFNAIALENVKV